MYENKKDEYLIKRQFSIYVWIFLVVAMILLIFNITRNIYLRMQSSSREIAEPQILIF